MNVRAFAYLLGTLLGRLVALAAVAWWVGVCVRVFRIGAGL